MSGHTPGPWEMQGREVVAIHGEEGHETHWLIISQLGARHCRLPKEQAFANARLIAAAPVLLEALKEIAKAEGRYSRDPLEHASNTIEDMQALAVKAIGKAEADD